MNKRNARLRREYLYRKGLEGAERAVYEKKRKVRDALDDGKVLPTELRAEYKTLQKEIDADDVVTGAARSTIVDEYARAGIADPKILITSSRDPTSRLMQFVKELCLVFPNAQRINRGGTQIKELVETARAANFTDIVMVHEHRGKPDGLVVSHLPYGPTAFFAMSGAVLRHDLTEKSPNMSQAFPHLVFDNFNSKLGERCKTILKHLFPVPKEDSKRVVTFSNRKDTISFRNHMYRMNHPDVELAEVGPRFQLRLYQIRLGTVDMVEAQDEWVLRPYMNTAKKRKVLA